MPKKKTANVERILNLARGLENAYKRIQRNAAANAEAVEHRKAALEALNNMRYENPDDDGVVAIARTIYLSDARMRNTSVRHMQAERAADMLIDILDNLDKA